MYKWIFPAGASALIHWIQSVPVQVTNCFNRNILKNNIELGGEESSASSLQKETLGTISLSEATSITPVEEKKESWFKRLFKKKQKPDSKSESQLLSGSLLLQEGVLIDANSPGSWAIESELSWEKVADQATIIVKGEVSQSKTGGIEIMEEESLEATDEVYYLPSNPKQASSPKKITSSSSSELSAEDLEEARAIFGN